MVYANAVIRPPWGLSASSLDRISSPRLWRVNACVFGAIITPKNAVRHHIIVRCASLHYLQIVFCLFIRPQTHLFFKLISLWQYSCFKMNRVGVLKDNKCQFGFSIIQQIRLINSNVMAGIGCTLHDRCTRNCITFQFSLLF